jgi:hypothetical protein
MTCCIQQQSRRRFVTPDRFAYGKSTRYQRHAHTLLTPFESVGVQARKRPALFDLESTTYGWFGVPRGDRNGFDSR